MNNSQNLNFRLFWATLSAGSVSYLEKVLPRKYPVKFQPHITLDYDFEKDKLKKYQKLAGQKYVITVSKLYWDDYIEAIAVDLPGFLKEVCINRHPHITWSSTGKFEPFYSNYMLHEAEKSQSYKTFKPVEIDVFLELR